MEGAILGIGGLIVIGHVLTALFRRTRIPDVLVLLLLGVAIGPAGLAYIRPEDFGKIGPVLTTIALIVILFEGGTGLSVPTIRRTFVHMTSVTMTTSVVTGCLVAVLAQPFLAQRLAAEGIPADTTTLWLLSAMLGAALSGTASVIVIPMVQSLGLGDRTRVILSLESAVTDVSCIVLVFGLIETLQQGEFHGLQLAGRMLSSLTMAGVIGAIGGLCWMFVLNRVRQLPNSFTLVFAVLFLLYALAEGMGFNGPIAALAFGITLTNVAPGVAARFPALQKVRVEQHTEAERALFAEAVFLVKLFFFVYLGISLRFTDPDVFMVGAAIVASVYGARLLIVRYLLRPSAASARDAAVAAVMVPKGLVAAVLVSVPVAMQVPGAVAVQDLAFAVVGLSIALTSLLVPLVSGPRAGWLVRACFPVHDRIPVEPPSGIRDGV